jgi:hypothetical protein
MTFTLSDGTEVEYHALTPADTLAALSEAPDDDKMFVKVIRLAAVKPEEVLEHLAGLPDPAEETAFLGSEIMLASLLAQARLMTLPRKRR